MRKIVLFAIIPYVRPYFLSDFLTVNINTITMPYMLGTFVHQLGD